MPDIKWLENAWNDYCSIEDKKTIRKVNDLIKDICRHPFDGIGKPEHLKSMNAWSRRIDSKNRLVYSYENNCIIVRYCINHYEDK